VSDENADAQALFISFNSVDPFIIGLTEMQGRKRRRGEYPVLCKNNEWDVFSLG
jgi:hypothetical protein